MNPAKKLISISLALSLIANPLSAIPTETVIVGDAQGALQHAQTISQFVEAYKKHEEMVTKAQEQINRLNEINNLATKANNKPPMPLLVLPILWKWWRISKAQWHRLKTT